MNRVYVSIFTSLIVAASCGDNAPNNASPDAHGTSGPIAIAVASVYGTPTGILSKLDVDALMMQTNLAAGVVKGDPILRRIDDMLYVINRDVHSITMLDARTLVPIDEVAVGGIGEAPNPWDVAVVGNKLFVPALDTNGVVVITRGSNERTTIDLRNVLECKAPCLPRCESAYAVGNDVYVACGLLTEDFKPTGNGNGKIAVIDGITNTVRPTAIEMPAKNPQNLIVRTPVASEFAGDLLIPTADYKTATNGCLVRVTPGPNPSATCAIQHIDLQGTATHVDVIETSSPLLLLSVTSNFTFGSEDGQLRVFDLESLQLWSGSISPPTQVINDVAACPNGKIVVADKSGSGGLRTYSASAGELTSTALSIGLPPGGGNQLACYTP